MLTSAPDISQAMNAEQACLQVCMGQAQCGYVPVVEVPLDAGHLTAGYHTSVTNSLYMSPQISPYLQSQQVSLSMCPALPILHNAQMRFTPTTHTCKTTLRYQQGYTPDDP